LRERPPNPPPQIFFFFTGLVELSLLWSFGRRRRRRIQEYQTVSSQNEKNMGKSMSFLFYFSFVLICEFFKIYYFILKLLILSRKTD